MDHKNGRDDGRPRKGCLKAARKPFIPLEERGRCTMTAVAHSGSSEMKRRLIVAVTGATGPIYGMRILQQLRAIGGWESHLVVSDAGGLNAWQEYGLTRNHLNKPADVGHNPREARASIAR